MEVLAGVKPGGIDAYSASIEPLGPYRAQCYAPNSYWNRALPANRPLYQHPTEPLANSANWVRSLCLQMGFDPDTPANDPTPNYVTGHYDGQAWIGREQEPVYIVPDDQPYRPFPNIGDVDGQPKSTWDAQHDALITHLGGQPIPRDLLVSNNADKYAVAFQPSQDRLFSNSVIGQFIAGETTLRLVSGTGSFRFTLQYGDHTRFPNTYTVQTPIPHDATAAAVKAAVDGALSPTGVTFHGGNTGRVTCSGGPLNVAPITMRFSIALPLTNVTVEFIDTALALEATYVTPGPYERSRHGGIITPDSNGAGGVSQHPGTYRTRTEGGLVLENKLWAGTATSIEPGLAFPSYDEVGEAQLEGRGLGHAVPFLVGHCQKSPIPYVWPATRGDGDRYSNPGYIAEGARVAFAPNEDLTYVQSTYPEWLWMALTMRDHGMILFDKTGGGCQFPFRRAQWYGKTFNPWVDLLPLYRTSGGGAAHYYMRSLPWHNAQVIDPAFSA